MRPKGGAAELEARRRRAAGCFGARESVGSVAERFGVDRRGAKRSRRSWREGDEDGLAAKPHPGGKCNLTGEQLDVLVESIVAGPREADFPTGLWACGRVVEVIENRFGVTYDTGHLARML